MVIVIGESARIVAASKGKAAFLAPEMRTSPSSLTPPVIKNLSIIILTYNEEQNLPKCLKSLEGLNAAIYIIDSFSTDQTQAIAEQHQTTFIQHEFKTHVKQWKFALSRPEINSEWVLGLDADQELSPELRKEIEWAKKEALQTQRSASIVKVVSCCLFFCLFYDS